MWKILTISIFFCASSVCWSAEGGAVIDAIAADVAVMASGIEAANARLAMLEAYAAAAATTAGLIMGLCVWRLALLSKNQKSLF